MSEVPDSPQFIPINEATAFLEVRRSRFIAVAHGMDSPAALKPQLEACRAAYPDATHVAYAYVLGTTNSETLGMSDAGEPKGTAGRPILDVIKGRQLTNVLVLVVRYFGGTKLGTGGLARAYGECAGLALERLAVRPLVSTCLFTLTVPYELYDGTIRLLQQQDARSMTQDFGEQVQIRGELPEENIGACEQAIADLSRGQMVIEILTDRGLNGTR